MSRHPYLALEVSAPGYVGVTLLALSQLGGCFRLPISYQINRSNRLQGPPSPAHQQHTSPTKYRGARNYSQNGTRI